MDARRYIYYGPAIILLGFNLYWYINIGPTNCLDKSITKYNFNNEYPSVDIVVVVHDALNELKDMLASINAFTEPLYHIYLITDRSSKATLYWLHEYIAMHSANVSLYHTVPPRTGYIHAVNLGIAQGTYPYVLVIEPDVVVTTNWLKNMIKCMQHKPQNSIVGPLSNDASYQSVPNIMDKNKLSSDWTLEGVSIAVSHLSDRIYPKVQHLDSFCILVKRVVFTRVRLFDANFIISSSKAGFNAVIDDATYIHHYNTPKHLQMHSKTEHDLVSLKGIRERLKFAYQYPELFQGPSMRILFLLPSSRIGGGSTSVVREAQEMKRMGVTVRIALWDKSFPLFLYAYPEDPDLFVPWPKKLISNDDYNAISKLRHYGTLFDVVVATAWISAYELLEMSRISRTFLPAYYVQDYEPDFFPINSTLEKQRVYANRSYQLVNELGGVMFSKSSWLANKVSNFHECKVYVVPAAIESLTCQNPGARTKNSTALRIVAMLRPSTPRRNAEHTYNILLKAKLKFGSKVEVITFGCNLEEATFIADKDFKMSHLGILNRSAISDLYMNTDVFLDMSIWQAYGRSAAEAMTCGNTAIVTQKGGTSEFIKDGYNGFLVDINNDNIILAIIKELVQYHERLEVMQQRARAVRHQLLLHPAVASRLQLFTTKLKERNKY